jgi:hypothetical protein
MIPAIVTGLCALAPTIAKWLGGDHAERVTAEVVGLAKTITGQTDDAAALAALRQNPELALAFDKAWRDYEVHLQQELTKRHESDMRSDSWLSKNVRPLCLLGLTLAITIAIFVPAQYVSAEKFRYLTDMSQWVYGYYFVGRSTFDKGNIKLMMGAGK